jgi:hypothetical protein
MSGCCEAVAQHRDHHQVADLEGKHGSDCLETCQSCAGEVQSLAYLVAVLGEVVRVELVQGFVFIVNLVHHLVASIAYYLFHIFQGSASLLQSRLTAFLYEDFGLPSHIAHFTPEFVCIVISFTVLSSFGYYLVNSIFGFISESASCLFGLVPVLL